MDKDKLLHRGMHKRFKEVEKANNIKQTLKRLIRYFVMEKYTLLAMLSAVIFAVSFNTAVPYLQKLAIDILTGTSDFSFAYCMDLLLLAYLGYAIALLLQHLMAARLSQRVIVKIRNELFSKIINLPISYVDRHSYGDLMSRISNDTDTISLTISQSLSSFVSGILTISFVSVMMFCLSWQLTLMAYFSIVLIFISTKIIAKFVIKFSRKRQELLGKLNGSTEENISNYLSLMAYNRQELSLKEFSQISDELAVTNIKRDICTGTMGPVMNCIRNISFLTCAVGGAYLVSEGYITVGVIAAFIVYVKQFSGPINELAEIYGQLQSAIACAERVFNVLDEESEDKAGDDFEIKDEALIEFRDINFSYIEGKPVINDFSFTIQPGKKIALVGETGCGKTTITNLLLRFYDLDTGRIFINGRDIASVKRDLLRDNIAIVLQEPSLFNDTLRHNLSYASSVSVSDEELNNALRLCHADKIGSNGLDTIIDNEISQGEKQLISIARAFVADPKILILDEATSNVDTRTEKQVQDAMRCVMAGRTSLIIAHRLSTIRDADEIIVMDKGSIVESGNHTELLQRKGRYYELYSAQMSS